MCANFGFGALVGGSQRSIIRDDRAAGDRRTYAVIALMMILVLTRRATRVFMRCDLARHRMAFLALSLAVTCITCWEAAQAAEPLKLRQPIACLPADGCLVQNYLDHDPSPGARDYKCGSLTYDGHDGTDFRLPTMAVMRAGVAVLAAADGRVSRVRDGEPDVKMTPDNPPAQGRECGNGLVISHRDGWETQYCHMAQGSLRVKPGDAVVAGQALGRVGLSGKTEFPHLHLTVRQHGKAVDPFAFEPTAECGSGTSLWDPTLGPTLGPLLAYRVGQVLNFGFSGEPVTMEGIESGSAGAAPPSREAPALVAFVRAVGLQAGDVQRMTLHAPNGDLLADSTPAPLDRPKAQYMMFVGKKRTVPQWPSGTYTATYTVKRGAEIAIEKRFDLVL
jgi:Peptidase family M23